MIQSLSQQGITRETYMSITGKSEDEVLEDAKPDAEQALRREAVIAAVIEAEDIKPSDGDVLEALTAAAVQENTTPEKLRARLEKNGRLGELQNDLAQGMAMDLLVEHAKPVARARRGAARPRSRRPRGARPLGRSARASGPGELRQVRRRRPRARRCGPPAACSRESLEEMISADRTAARIAKPEPIMNAREYPSTRASGRRAAPAPNSAILDVETETRMRRRARRRPAARC